MEHRVVLQGDQNTPENQVIHRNQHECRADTDLDSTNHNTAFKDTSKGSKTRLAPLKFGVFYSIKSFCEN